MSEITERLKTAFPEQFTALERGHSVPYYMMVQETLDWLDRFLGPI